MTLPPIHMREIRLFAARHKFRGHPNPSTGALSAAAVGADLKMVTLKLASSNREVLAHLGAAEVWGPRFNSSAANHIVKEVSLLS
jgi:hypothetical protein